MIKSLILLVVTFMYVSGLLIMGLDVHGMYIGYKPVEAQTIALDVLTAVTAFFPPLGAVVGALRIYIMFF